MHCGCACVIEYTIFILLSHKMAMFYLNKDAL